MRKRIYLIDGSAVIYRSYFAFIRSPLINSKGENCSAPFGFFNILLKILIDEKPDYIAIVFDTGQPTFRHLMYDQYKITREKMPDDLKNSIPKVHKLSEYMHIPILEMNGFEADDIIGTISLEAEKEGMDVFLVSGDKDFMQLITDKTVMYGLGKGGRDAEISSFEAVNEKFGVKPSQVIDVLALMGDASDNVPGVQGIGAKTATALIQEFGSLENLYENIHTLKQSKNKERLIEQKETAFLSKQLVTIKRDVPIEFDFNQMTVDSPDMDNLKLLLADLEFKQFDSRLFEYAGHLNGRVQSKIQTASSHDYLLIQSLNDLNLLLNEISKKITAVDTETDSLNSLNCELVGISFAYESGHAFYLAMNSDFAQTFQRQILSALKSYFENPEYKKIGHNIKFDALVLSQYGIDMQGIAFDTMIAHYLLHPGARNHKLDDLAMNFCNHQMIPIEELIGKGTKQGSMKDVDIAKVCEYAAEDADYTFRLYEILSPMLKHEGLDSVFYSIEMPLISTLIRMEKNGVHLNSDFLNEMSQKMASDIVTLENEIYQLAGENFNIASPKQLGLILFEKLEIHKSLGKRGPKKTASGQYSTAEAELQKFIHHEIVQKILEYRELAKLKSTYVDALPNMINPKSNAVHTSFNQTIAATGRLSSTDPNLQNIPIRTDIGREIRKAFIPSSNDRILISADYSQIELRIMAHMADDKQMISAFIKQQDIHSATAALIFNVDIKDVTTDMRRKAKEINFGIIYGMSQWGLAARLQISSEEAKAFIDNYFIQYPSIQNFMVNTVAGAKKTMEVRMLSGRKRQIPDINSENRQVAEAAERVAINTPIQGSAADLIKMAMIAIDKEIIEKKLTTKMILQVHDELVFDSDPAEFEQIAEIITRCMEHAMHLKVPLKTAIGKGKNWLEAH